MYIVELMPKAIKDLKKIPKPYAVRIAMETKLLENGLVGNIKKLTNFTPGYRLRVGNYHVLFKHRKEAYSRK